MMDNVCIIPARGGSKRIPRKNIKPFASKPIIGWSIEKAKQSGLFDKVIVSTDDAEIADISRSFGAEVPFFRSKKNSDDFATTSSVIWEVLQQLEKVSQNYKYCCCLYPTAPLVTLDSLKLGYETILREGCLSVIPITEFDFPIWRSVNVSNSWNVKMNFPDFTNTRSQDLPSTYHDAGQWYWLDVEQFKTEPNMWAENTKGILLSREQVQDIDTESDWKIAELKFQILNQSNNLESFQK